MSIITAFEPYAPALINRGSFVPATYRTPEVARFEAFKTGWFLQFNMNEFAGRYNDFRNETTLPNGRSADPPPATTFDLSTVNVKAWVTAAKARNVQYLVLTAINEYGFKLWRSNVDYKMERTTIDARQGGFPSPFYASYQVTGGADRNICEVFVTECRAAGIEPIFYWNMVNDLNIVDGNSFNAIKAPNGSTNGYNGTIPLTRQQELVDYYCRLIQESILRFGLRYQWFDYGNIIPDWAIQKYYDAVKSVDPTCQVIGNAMMWNQVQDQAPAGTPLRFPCDIASTEDYYLFSQQPPTTSWQNNTVSHNGVDYYCGQELCGTIYYSWYWYDRLGINDHWGSREGYEEKPEVKASQQHWQEFINLARSRNRPFLTSIFIDRYGNILQNGLDFYDQLDFTGNN